MKYLWFLLIIYLAYQTGKEDKQKEIESRAQLLKEDCITNQQMEIVIFGEKQE